MPVMKSLASMVVLVEDAGLRFEARNALPWALIKRFMKEVGTQGLLDQLSIFKNRNAEALCCVGFFDGETVHKFIGKVKWTISETPRWETNFWWDPIFIPNGSEKTFWEMNPEEKNAMSHRKLAREQAKIFFDQNN